MKRTLLNLLLIASSALTLIQGSVALAESADLSGIISRLSSETGRPGNAADGELFWSRKFNGSAPFTERSCASCHSTRLTQAGKHVRTQKTIQPLAPSVNPKSLTDSRKINKWLLRNCKWTVGRECSAEEKLNILTFLKQQ